MPVQGKKVSPQEMIGQSFHTVIHKIDRGEHQMWFSNDSHRYIFFQPIYCCDAVTVDYFDPLEAMEDRTISSISFDKGKYTFSLPQDDWVLQWTSRKKFYNIPLVLLSRQDV